MDNRLVPRIALALLEIALTAEVLRADAGASPELAASPPQRDPRASGTPAEGPSRAARADEAVRRAEVAWRRVAELPRAGGATALALETASGDLAVGDLSGVLRVRSDGALARVLRRGPTRDLAFLASGDLLAATEQGLYRIDTAGRAREVAPAPGAARRPVRLSAAGGVVAVATEDGAFLSRDGARWTRIDGLPSGPVAAVALRPADAGLECFALARGDLLAVAVALRGGELTAGPARRQELALAFRQDPVDVVPGLAGADLALLFPTALALRERPESAWRLVQPALPPGAQAHRVAAGLGRLWLATDHGLLEAEAPEGPWQRAAEPAGSQQVGALVGGAASLHAAVAGAVLAAGPPLRTPPRAILAELPEDPPIERVHRAALDFLDLGRARIDEMRRGIRSRGWLPELSFVGAASRDRDRGAGYDESFVSGALRQLVDRDEGSSQDNALSFNLTWELADLAYHPDQIDISREAREVIELRDDVLDEITQLYFERRRVLVELAAAESAADALRLRLRAAELAAGIDAWTGGWFSRALREATP